MNDDEPMASDKLLDIDEWICNMQAELEKERIDLVELEQINRVYEIIKEKLS